MQAEHAPVQIASSNKQQAILRSAPSAQWHIAIALKAGRGWKRDRDSGGGGEPAKGSRLIGIAVRDSVLT